MLSKEIKLAVMGRASARCECVRNGHGHDGRCDTIVIGPRARFLLVGPEPGERPNDWEVLCPYCYDWETPMEGR